MPSQRAGAAGLRRGGWPGSPFQCPHRCPPWCRPECSVPFFRSFLWFPFSPSPWPDCAGMYGELTKVEIAVDKVVRALKRSLPAPAAFFYRAQGFVAQPLVRISPQPGLIQRQAVPAVSPSPLWCPMRLRLGGMQDAGCGKGSPRCSQAIQLRCCGGLSWLSGESAQGLWICGVQDEGGRREGPPAHGWGENLPLPSCAPPP